MSRGEALVVRAFALWTVFVWGNRIGNIVSDDSRSFGFKAVHVALALVSVAFAIAAWMAVARSRRRSRMGTPVS